MNVRIYDESWSEVISETDWPSFCDANRDAMDEDELEALYQTLRTEGRVWVGGGAAPLVVIVRADR